MTTTPSVPFVRCAKPLLRRWLVGCAASLWLAACDESGPRIYTAQAYVLEADCLSGYAPIGLVEAKTLDSTCDAVCLRIDQLYVSSVCAPYPVEATPEDPALSPECAAALAAFDAELACDAPDAGP